MLQHTKLRSDGFTLIELLVALAVFGGISIAIVGSLYTILITRSKQLSIETSASMSRAVLTTITNGIVGARQVAIPSPDTIEMTGSPCRTIRKNGSIIEQAIDDTASCVPPGSGFAQFTPDGITVTSFTAMLDSGGGAINIEFGGTYSDSFGSHDFEYTTSAVPRITL